MLFDYLIISILDTIIIVYLTKYLLVILIDCNCKANQTQHNATFATTS